MAHVRSVGQIRAGVISQPVRRLSWLAPLFVMACVGPAAAQIVEGTGSRALGMGGAFVAVADDASATWWNPAGLADAPFFNMSLSRAVTESSDGIPARRDGVSSFAIGWPAAGFSYYRLRLTEIRDSSPTDGGADGRQEEQGDVPVRSLGVSQIGLTFLHTLVSGVHAGTTLKYLRGTPRAEIVSTGGPVEDLLGHGDDLEGGDTDHEFDLDVGILAAYGALKVGAVMRNVREPQFEDAGEARRLPRQARLGIAFDGARAERLPLTASLDVDLRRYETATGDRRVVALGVEGWLFRRRLGLRAGGRFNTVGAEDRAATAGLSIALRSALFLDGHLVRGGTAEDRGWGLAARVSFGGFR